MMLGDKSICLVEPNSDVTSFSLAVSLAHAPRSPPRWAGRYVRSKRGTHSTDFPRLERACSRFVASPHVVSRREKPNNHAVFWIKKGAAALRGESMDAKVISMGWCWLMPFSTPSPHSPDRPHPCHSSRATSVAVAGGRRSDRASSRWRQGPARRSQHSAASMTPRCAGNCGSSPSRAGRAGRATGPAAAPGTQCPMLPTWSAQGGG